MMYFVLTLLLLLLLGTPVYSYAARPAGKSTIKVHGELVVADLHEAGKEWAIRKKDGRLQLLARNLQPTKDKNGRLLQPGATVRLDCVLDANGACGSVSPFAFTLKQEKLALAANRPESVGQQRLLAMILDFSYGNGLKPSLTESQVRNIILGPAGDGSGGLAQKYSQCSYGMFGINGTAFKVITVAPRGNTGQMSRCEFSGIAEIADTSAAAAIGGLEIFSHYMYILPPGMQGICGWAGMAIIPGTQIWLQTSEQGIGRWAVAMQESIHNYGLWNSWQNGMEYQDYSTAMGLGDACPNAAEISRLGWATPAIGGGALNSTTLLPGKVRTFKLPATYLTDTGNYLRVQPDWLPVYTNRNLARNLYIAVRVAKAADMTIRPDYAGKINIHEVLALADNYLPDSYKNFDRRINFINAVPPFTREVLSGYSLVVYGGSWSASDILAVHLCRYNVAHSECPELDALESMPHPNPWPPSPLNRPYLLDPPLSNPWPAPSPHPHPSTPKVRPPPTTPKTRPPPSPPKTRPPPSPPKTRPPPSSPKLRPPPSPPKPRSPPQS